MNVLFEKIFEKMKWKPLENKKQKPFKNQENVINGLVSEKKGLRV